MTGHRDQSSEPPGMEDESGWVLQREGRPGKSRHCYLVNSQSCFGPLDFNLSWWGTACLNVGDCLSIGKKNGLLFR